MDLNKLCVLHHQALTYAVQAADDATRERYQSVANLFSESIVRRQRDTGGGALPLFYIQSDTGNAEDGRSIHC
jgi:hypothetical protein